MNGSASTSTGTGRLTRAEILRRVEQGEDLDALVDTIAQSRLSPAAQAVMWRASLTRGFDADLFQRVLASGAEAVTLDDLLHAGAIEAVAGSEGRYRVPDAARLSWLQSWFAVPESPERFPEVEEVERQLVRYFEAQGDAGAIPLLYHASIFERERARELFERLYDEADRTFDRARCAEVLRALYDGQSLLVGDRMFASPDPKLTEIYADRSHYLDARNLWCNDYYATGRTLARPALDAAFTTLLDDPARWALSIWARGGMGKTTFLRWAISRACVPAPRRIPCARVDFDHLERGTEERAPWLVFLRFAEQLDIQLTGAPFRSLTSEGRALRDLRARGAAKAQVGAFVDRFTAILASAAEGRRVLLVLDTCEEAILYRRADFAALLTDLRALHERCPGVRVVLSGRYDVRDRMPAESAAFGDALQSIEVQPFTDDEAERYLASRGIAADDTPRGTVAKLAIARAEGLPFKLALLADLMQVRSDLIVDDLADANIDLVYLIERVVDRIPDSKVQWLLRYGVVPRRLTFDFVRDVMAEMLPDATAGKSQIDDARRGLTEKQQGRVFATGTDPKRALPAAPDEPTMRALWDGLKQYAAGSSWVTEIGPDTLRFHPDVVEPMRALLRENDVFVELHRAAIACWRRRAEAVPEERAACSREVVYHLFQIDPKEGERAFHAEMERATTAGDAAWQYGLAQEVTSPPFVDEEGLPAEGASAALVARGWFARAHAALDLSSSEPDSKARDEADSLVATLARLGEKAPDLVPAAELTALRAKVRLALGDANGALREMTTWSDAVLPQLAPPRDPAEIGALDTAAIDVRTLRSPTDGDSVTSAELLAGMRTLAATLLALGRTDALPYAEVAARLAEQSPELPPPTRFAVLALHADALALAGKHRAARALLAQALSGSLTNAERTDMTLRDAHAALEMNDGLLPKMVDAVLADDRLEATELFLLAAESSRRRGALDNARIAADKVRSILNRTRSTSTDIAPSADYRRVTALCEEALARIHADALDLEAAHTRFHSARAAWKTLGELEASERCRAHDTILAVVEEDDWPAFASLLERPDRIAEMAPSMHATLLGLWASAPPSPLRNASHASLRQIFERMDRRWSPMLRAEIVQPVLAFDPTDLSAQDHLARALSELDSPEAALQALSTIARVPRIEAPSRALIAAFERLLPLAEPLDHPSAGRRVLRLVEVLRILGRADDAVNLLERSAKSASETAWTATLAHLRAGLLAADRLGVDACTRVRAALPDPLRPHTTARAAPSFGTLHDIAALEQAERLARAGHPQEALDIARELDASSAKKAWATPWRARLRALLALDDTANLLPGDDSHGPTSPPDVRPAWRQTLWIAGDHRWTAALLPEGSLDRSSESPAQTSLMDRITNGWDHPIPQRTVAMLAGTWTSLTSEMGEALDSVVRASTSHGLEDLLGPRSPSIDIAIRLNDWRMAALPWELSRVAFDRRHPLGFLGSVRALHRPRLYPGSERIIWPWRPPGILLVQPRAEMEQRGEREIDRGSLDALYRSKGLRFESIDEPSLDDIVRPLLESPWSLLHLRGVLREEEDGGVVWGFQPFVRGGFESFSTRGAEIEPGALGRVLAKSATPGVLVVLEPLAARGPDETVRQLLLRNRFASELRQSAYETPVLAIGLTRRPVWNVRSALAQAASRKTSLATLTRDVLDSYREDESSALIESPRSIEHEAPFAVALFCDDPDQRVNGGDPTDDG